MNRADDIFRETYCLTEQQMCNYIQGRLSSDEVHKVELHIASCDFCADALDGLSEMKKPQELPVIVNQIRNRFGHHLHTRRFPRNQKKHYVWLVLVAFVIILIVLLAYFAIDFTMKREHQNSQSSPLQEQQDNIPIR